MRTTTETLDRRANRRWMPKPVMVHKSKKRYSRKDKGWKLDT